MKLSENARATRSRSSTTAAIGLLSLALFFALTLASSAGAASSAVPLGAADGFAVLAGSGITNTGPTTINGDIGTYPTITMTGTASITQTGTNHGSDAVTQQAKTDLVTAYNNAAGQGPTSPIAADLGGQTLTAGVYNSASSIGLTGALTLNAAGDPNAVFVFQAGSTLTTASGSQINLINGAQSCNVFWQIGSSATLGTGSKFMGTILASASITVTTGVTVDGRVLARDGAVTLDNDTIVRATCAAAPPSTTPTATTPTPTTPTPTTPAPTTPAPTAPTPTTPTPTTPTPTPKPPVKPKPAPVANKQVKAASTPSPAAHPFGLTG